MCGPPLVQNRGRIMSNNLYRSTTPTIILHIKDQDFDMTTIDICHVTIENDSGRNKKTFEIGSENIDASERTISLELTQQETAKFEAGFVKLQLKLKTTDGKVIASKIVITKIDEILEEDIL